MDRNARPYFPPPLRALRNLWTAPKTKQHSGQISEHPEVVRFHSWSSAQCLWTSGRKIMNLEPSNGGVARNSESISWGPPSEPITEYPELIRSIVYHLHNACWHPDEKSWILSHQTVKLQEILKVFPSNLHRSRFQGIRKWPNPILIIGTMKAGWKITNFEPSNGGVARNSESVPWRFLPEPVPEYPDLEAARSIVDHRLNTCWHLVEKPRILSRQMVELQEILSVPSGTGSGVSGSIRIQCWSDREHSLKAEPFPVSWEMFWPMHDNIWVPNLYHRPLKL